jgi:hypothetical protein
MVNKLVKNYMERGGSDKMLDLRIQQVKSELEELNSRREMKREELERLQAVRDKQQSEREVERQQNVKQRAAQYTVSDGFKSGPPMITAPDERVRSDAEQFGLSEREFRRQIYDANGYDPDVAEWRGPGGEDA